MGQGRMGSFQLEVLGGNARYFHFLGQGGQGCARDKVGASLSGVSDRDPDLPAGAEQQPAEGVGGKGYECSGQGLSPGCCYTIRILGT